MGRIVLVNQDLRGRVLDASTQPDGHARESLFQDCNLEGTTFLGDWRGSDFISCTGGADWTGARIHACYWQGCTLTGSKFPTDLGPIHAEPIGEIVRARAVEAISLIPRRERKKLTDALTELMTKLGTTHISWVPSANFMDARVAPSVGRLFFRKVFELYPRIAAWYEQFLVDRDAGLAQVIDVITSIDISWPDGAKLTVDTMALPALAEPSRYALARWIEEQADALGVGKVIGYEMQTPVVLDKHHCFVYSLLPLTLRSMTAADEWLTFEDVGY